MTAARQLRSLGGLEPAFARAAAARLGHDLGGGFAERLNPAVLRAAENVGESELARFLERLNERDPTVEQAFIEALTVGETYFFRDPKHFDFLRERLVERREAGTGGRVRLWSAGCATGEEPYSMAILALEVFGHAATAFVEVIATDINADFLRRARVGIYGEWSFRGTPPLLRPTWFEPASGRFRVKSSVRGLVTFGPLNLARSAETEAGPSDVDFVFCRNVLVYFGRDGIRTAQERFAGALRVGGHLVPGPSDPLLDAADLEIDLGRGFVTYRRTSAEARGKKAPAKTSARAETTAPKARPVRRSPPKSVRAVPSPPPSNRADSRPSVEDVVARAQALATDGDIAGGVAALDRLIARERLAASAYVVRGALRLAAGDAKGALADGTNAHLLDRGLAFAQVVVATANVQLGDGPAVLKACRSARKALAALPADSVVPFAGGATAAELFATCRDAERAVERRAERGGRR